MPIARQHLLKLIYLCLRSSECVVLGYKLKCISFKVLRLQFLKATSVGYLSKVMLCWSNNLFPFKKWLWIWYWELEGRDWVSDGNIGGPFCSLWTGCTLTHHCLIKWKWHTWDQVLPDPEHTTQWWKLVVLSPSMHSASHLPPDPLPTARLPWGVPFDLLAEGKREQNPNT